MIPKDVLIAEIEKFDKLFQELDKKCDEATEPSGIHLEWYKMQKAWGKLQDAVEYNLLPFTESIKP